MSAGLERILSDPRHACCSMLIPAQCSARPTYKPANICSQRHDFGLPRAPQADPNPVPQGRREDCPCGIAGYVLRGPSSDLRVARTLLSGVRSRGPDQRGIFLADRAHGHLVAWATSTARPLCRPSATSPRERRRAGARPGLSCMPGTPSSIFFHRRAPAVPQPGPRHHGGLRQQGADYIELRRQLEAAGTTFHTASDTEALVEAPQLGRFPLVAAQRVLGRCALRPSVRDPHAFARSHGRRAALHPRQRVGSSSPARSGPSSRSRPRVFAGTTPAYSDSSRRA